MSRKKSFYEKYIKRIIDFVVALVAIVVLSPVYLVTAILVRSRLGSPVLFTQPRPGKDGRIFKMYKFRSMTDERDADGKLLPDEVRLTEFGKKLRETSLDELPELLNILKGDMSLIGPRPQLVRDMVFMTPQQNERHSVRQGLTGLAQINGRNAISWEAKLEYDRQYIQRITFRNDMKILIGTVKSVFEKEGITADGMATAEDYGDYLLHSGQITQQQYEDGQKEARRLLEGR